MFGQRPSRPRAFPHLLTAPVPLPVCSQSALMGLSVPSRRPPTPPELSVNSSTPRLAFHPGPWRGVACNTNCPGLGPQFGGLLPCAQTSLPAPPPPAFYHSGLSLASSRERPHSGISLTYSRAPIYRRALSHGRSGPLLQRAPNEIQQS